MDFAASMIVAAAGMRTQTDRMRVIAENIANANSTSAVSGGDPYRRKIPTIKSTFDRDLQATIIEPGKPIRDMSEFQLKLDPANPAADKHGYVKMSNVNSLIEIMDMREAQRSYEADLTVLDASKTMMTRTIDLLRR